MENPHSDQSIAFARVEKIIKSYLVRQGALVVIQHIKQELSGIQSTILQQDDQFNEALIQLLSEKFKMDPFEIAMLLNTPASKRWMEVNKPNTNPTYFSVLPADIISLITNFKVGNTPFEQLDNSIARIKAFAETNLNLKQKLFTDIEYNKALINYLSTVFRVAPAEVAFMLGTPISLEEMHVMEKRIGGIPYLGVGLLRKNIRDYLHSLFKVSSEAERIAIAIKYLNRFINHPYYSIVSIKNTNNQYPFDENYYKYVKHLFDENYYGYVDYLYAIVYNRQDFTSREFAEEMALVDEYETVDVNKRLEIALELDKSEQWLSQWTQRFQKERFWSLFAKSLMMHMASRDDKKVNILINVLLANKEKIKKHLRDFLKDQPIYSVKTPTYRELLESFQNYIENTGNYALLDKLKEFLDSESVALIAQKLLIASLSKQALTSAQLKQFISHGADVHKEIVKEKAQQFITNLNKATISLEIINLLISLGADINKPDSNNEYLLIKAIKSKQPAFVRMVLDLPGIKVDICQDGYNPLWYAQNVDMDTAIRTAIIDMLQEKGASEDGTCIIQ